MENSDFVALYAAILSTIAIGWHIARDLKDRGKIVLSGYFGKEISVGLPPRSVVAFVITNTGRRPVEVKSIWAQPTSSPLVNWLRLALPRWLRWFLPRHARTTTGGFIFSNETPIPKRLEEGESYTVIMSNYHTLASTTLGFCVVDSRGITWWMKRKIAKSIVHGVRQHVEESPE